MELVVHLLQKELERQNILITANKRDKQNRADFPEIKTSGPLIETVYPNMIQLRDEIEKAIKILSHKRWERKSRM